MTKRTNAPDVDKSPRPRAYLAHTRPVFDGLRRLLTLDAPTLRKALADELRPILWDEAQRSSFLRFFQQVPLSMTDDNFWLAIQATDEADRPPPPQNGPFAPYPAERAVAEYFAWCDRQRYRMSEPWPFPAQIILLGLRNLRRDAWMELTANVKTYRAAWEAGDTKALVALVRTDGVREPWVQEVIAQLRHRRVTGTKREQQRAEELLKKVCRALLAVVISGRRVELTPQQRRKKKRDDNLVTRTAAVLHRRRRRALRFPDGIVEPEEEKRACDAAIAKTSAEGRDPAILKIAVRRFRSTTLHPQKARPK